MIIGLIPSRLNSRRLKHKPLLEIDGLPIIVHTFKRAMLAKKLDKVIVCADDKKIVEVVKKHGGNALLTSKKFNNGTERIAHVSKKFKNSKLIVDIQGDEPLVDPKDIDRVISFHLKNKQFEIVVPCMPAKENIMSRNLVKVVFTDKGKVLYFSRAVIPFNFKDKKVKYFRDLSIVSFLPKILTKYSKLKMGFNEKVEGIELIRAIENDIKIGTFIASNSGFAVDVNQDLMKAINVMPHNKIRKMY
jgi:3-deoxy-manno-octulosonate cytidylyltransferase (CMP-KDO synthetase)